MSELRRNEELEIERRIGIGWIYWEELEMNKDGRTDWK